MSKIDDLLERAILEVPEYVSKGRLWASEKLEKLASQIEDRGRPTTEQDVVDAAFVVFEQWLSSPDLGQLVLPNLFQTLEAFDEDRYRRTTNEALEGQRREPRDTL